MRNSLVQIEALYRAKGKNDILDIIRRNSNNDEFCRFLYYALNPMLTYKVSESRLRQPFIYTTSAPIPPSMLNIFSICEELSSRKALDYITLEQVCAFLEVCEPDEKDIYIKLLAKTLRLGVTAKSVNKVIPGLIPTWEVQQAYPIDEHSIKDGEWFALTQKLNGVRATFYKGKLYARSGIQFDGLEHIIQEFAWDVNAEYVFDGELTLLDKGGLSDNESFRKATGIINSDRDKTGICYTIFDMVSTLEFESDGCLTTYAVRRKELETIAHNFSVNGYVQILPVLYMGTDQSKIPELLEKMVNEDKEGLIANLDVPYRRKRHKGILKIKEFYTMDLPIIRCEEGTGRLSGTLGSFVVSFFDDEVGIGSGFTDREREEFWGMREEIVGMLCEVRYKEISSDKNTGAKSLQFPSFVRLRADKEDVSYG